MLTETYIDPNMVGSGQPYNVELNQQKGMIVIYYT